MSGESNIQADELPVDLTSLLRFCETVCPCLASHRSTNRGLPLWLVLESERLPIGHSSESRSLLGSSALILRSNLNLTASLTGHHL